MKKTTSEIKNIFFDFFLKKKHKIISGSSLIPSNDKTLLFTNAGMNQFKDIFLGKSHIDYPRIVTIQNCLRTGGKHNDLNNVGYTKYHHTFFEMLGNFSFGNYFKKEAIIYAWELLTNANWFHLDQNKLIVTVHNYDNETYDIWKNIIKIPKAQIVKTGNKHYFNENSENFWQMASTGPCGPCTEIFYNTEETLSLYELLKNFKQHQSKFIEIWNIVFMQFHRTNNGTLITLPKLSVDTGMGLERISAIIQKVHSNYEIDIFQALINTIYKLCNIKNPNRKSLQVISDHIRSSAFIIAENIIPSNDTRGYVLRKIIRRAMRFGLKLNIKIPFLYKLVPSLIKIMKHNNSILKKNQKKIEESLKKEELSFQHTLNIGLKHLNAQIKKIKNNILDGKFVFKLYDTFGFPVDLTKDVCRENNIILDYSGFLKEMKQQKKRSKEHKKFITFYDNYINTNNITKFYGYDSIETQGTIIAIYKNKISVNTLLVGEEGLLILDNTTFYGESGGQVGDIGSIHNKIALFNVIDTKKYGNTIIHIGKIVSGTLNVSDKVISKINFKRRFNIQNNHTATHLLHAVLQKKLGSNVKQKGSLITSKYLRFDFFYTETINSVMLNEIEELINLQIQKNVVINTTIMNLSDTKNQNIIGLFQHKYENKVRVVLIDQISSEICIGTHSKRTGNIGLFKITSKHKISSDIYRIEGYTGTIALKYIQQQSQEIEKIATLLKQDRFNLKEKIKLLIEHSLIQTKKLINFEKQEISNTILTLEKKTILINQSKIIFHKFKNKNVKLLRNAINSLKYKLKLTVIILINIHTHNKITFITGVTLDLLKKINAITIIKFLSNLFHGRGGGKLDLAEGGGKYTEDLHKILNTVIPWISSKLDTTPAKKYD